MALDATNQNKNPFEVSGVLTQSELMDVNYAAEHGDSVAGVATGGAERKRREQEIANRKGTTQYTFASAVATNLSISNQDYIGNLARGMIGRGMNTEALVEGSTEEKIQTIIDEIGQEAFDAMAEDAMTEFSLTREEAEELVAEAMTTNVMMEEALRQTKDLEYLSPAMSAAMADQALSLKDAEILFQDNLADNIGDINNNIYVTGLQIDRLQGLIDKEMASDNPNTDKLSNLQEQQNDLQSFHDTQTQRLMVAVETYAVQFDILSLAEAQNTNLAGLSAADIQMFISSTPDSFINEAARLQALDPDANPLRYMDDIILGAIGNPDFSNEDIEQLESMRDDVAGQIDEAETLATLDLKMEPTDIKLQITSVAEALLYSGGSTSYDDILNVLDQKGISAASQDRYAEKVLDKMYEIDPAVKVSNVPAGIDAPQNKVAPQLPQPQQPLFIPETLEKQ